MSPQPYYLSQQSPSIHLHRAATEMGGIRPLLLLVLLSLLVLPALSDSSLQDECSPVLTKVTECLNYATAKSDTPSDPCCKAVSDIRGKDPACLCYVIQQTHDGGSGAKSLGLQFERLIQLPQACNQANSSLRDCPKLLKLSPSSPDSAIFTNTTKATSVSTGSNKTGPKSEGFMQQFHFGCTFALAVLSAIFLSNFYMSA